MSMTEMLEMVCSQGKTDGWTVQNCGAYILSVYVILGPHGTGTFLRLAHFQQVHRSRDDVMWR